MTTYHQEDCTLCSNKTREQWVRHNVIHIQPLSYFAMPPTSMRSFRIERYAFRPIRITDAVVAYKYYGQVY